jgi:polyphosphate kinase
LRRYAHLGTGNYHARTARLYTDFGLFTCADEICSDINDVFSQLTGLGKASKLNHLWQAPFTLHSNLLKAIQNEAQLAKSGKPAAIIAKMNSLLDPQIIRALYQASCAGVKIDLIVRGACALRPGIPKVSENIRVRSVIGRFLEHSRIFYFSNHGKQDVYLSSADWMDRNFFRRIEVCFPVLNIRLKKRIISEGLKLYLKDNCQSWEMGKTGEYSRKKTRKDQAHHAQLTLLATLAINQ